MLSALWRPATAGPEETYGRGPTSLATRHPTRDSVAPQSTTDMGHLQVEGEVTTATMVNPQDQEVMAVPTVPIVTMETMALLVAMVTTNPMVAIAPTLSVGDMEDIVGMGLPVGVTTVEVMGVMGDRTGATAAVAGMGALVEGGTDVTSSASSELTNSVCTHW